MELRGVRGGRGRRTGADTGRTDADRCPGAPVPAPDPRNSQPTPALSHPSLQVHEDVVFTGPSWRAGKTTVSTLG